jgi:hypothetical protein
MTVAAAAQREHLSLRTALAPVAAADEKEHHEDHEPCTARPEFSFPASGGRAGNGASRHVGVSAAVAPTNVAVTDSGGERRYDEQEVGRLLKRATELQQRAPARMRPAGLTLDELADIAAEAGIDVALLRQAALELDTQPAGPGSRVGVALAGAPLRFVLERTLPFETPARAFAELLPALQAASGGSGQAGVVGRTLTWTATTAGDPHGLQVTIAVRSGTTVVRIEERHTALAGALIGGVGAGVGGGVGIGVGGTIGGVLGSVALAVTLPVVIIAGAFGMTRALFRRFVHKRRRVLEHLMHDLVARLEASRDEPSLLHDPERG